MTARAVLPFLAGTNYFGGSGGLSKWVNNGDKWVTR